MSCHEGHGLSDLPCGGELADRPHPLLILWNAADALFSRRPGPPLTVPAIPGLAFTMPNLSSRYVLPYYPIRQLSAPTHLHENVTTVCDWTTRSPYVHCAVSGLNLSSLNIEKSFLDLGSDGAFRPV